MPEIYFNEDDYISIYPHLADDIERGLITAYGHYQEQAAKGETFWFPGTPSQEHVAWIVSRYRSFTLTEPGKLAELEARVAAR